MHAYSDDLMMSLDLDLDLIYSELAMEPAARGWPKEVQDAGNIG